MLYRTLADVVIIVHFAFILFAVAGGLLLLIRQIPRWFAFVHLTSAAWGSFVMFSGRICPLTPLENRLRQLGGEVGYDTSFIERYLLGVIYPEGLTRDFQIALGVAVLLFNVLIYAVVLLKPKRANRSARKRES